MKAKYRMGIMPATKGQWHFLGVRCDVADAAQCASALSGIHCGEVKWMARRMAEPTYDGAELYVSQIGQWSDGIGRFGPEKLADELDKLGFEREAA